MPPSGSSSRTLGSSTATGWAVLLHKAPVDPVLDALRPYRNPDA